MPDRPFLWFLFVFVIALGQGYCPRAEAQILHPVTWSYRLEPAKPKAGQQAELVISASIEAGWHLYGPDFDPDLGPVVLTLALKADPSYKSEGKLRPIGAHMHHDDVFDGDIQEWTGRGELRQKIKILALPLRLAGSMEAQACTDAGKCVQVPDDFELKVEAGVAKTENAPGKKVLTQITTRDAEDNPTDTTVGANAKNQKEEPLIDPFSGKPLVAIQDTPQAARPDTAAAMPLSVTRAEAKIKAKTAAAQEDGSLWTWFFAAFSGGLLALLTPCVYPMIPMTVSFFTQDSRSRASAIGKALFYGLSIVGIYVLLGVLVSRVFGGDVANELATHWIPNVLFFVVFLLFGFSFLGYFEIILPSAWATAADARAEKGGPVGIFFMALTLVVVSFSCTGPVASSILLSSAGGQLARPVVGMLGYSLAFALPFSFFAAFPQLLSRLPRSGGWLNTVKVVFGFIELALAFKFLSIADLAYHWHLLDREIFLSIWIVLGLLMGIYLLGGLRFPHDSDPGPIHWLRFVLAVGTFVFVAYLVPGLWGAPLRGLSGYLPPITTQDFISVGGGGSITGPVSPTGAHPPGCPAPRYADFLHLPYGVSGYFDLKQALACAKATGKPVLIDFTGHGCTNCREMESKVWSDPRVLVRLKRDFVVCALYVDDRTELPAPEHYTSPTDGKLKITIGKQNLDLQTRRFGTNAQPSYVILSPDDQILAGPRAYDLSIEGFEGFLDGVKGGVAGR